MPAQFPSLKSGSLLYCVGYGIREYSLERFFLFLTLLLSSFWTSRGHRCRPFSPRFLRSFFIAHRVQQSHCSSFFHRVLLTHALALSASLFGHKKKSQRIYTSMHSAGLELTKLAYTRLEDNLYTTGATGEIISHSRGRPHRCGKCGASRWSRAGPPHHKWHGGTARRRLSLHW